MWMLGSASNLRQDNCLVACLTKTSPRGTCMQLVSLQFVGLIFTAILDAMQES